MTPNLRYNKKLTKKLLKSCPFAEDKLQPQTVLWNINNDNGIFGSWSRGLLCGTNIFMISKFKENLYRLLVSDETGLIGIYLIDNIEDYLQVVGAERLELENEKEVKNIIEQTLTLPSTGIISIEENKVFVYDHTNY